MGSFWHWITRNWGPLGIGTRAFEILKCVYPSRADFTAKRQTTKDERSDEQVLAALCDPQVERQSRGTTGCGFPLSRVSEIAFHIQEDRNAVYESLLRLDQRGRVTSNDGFWFPLPD
jgi:hypothetical protein